MQKMQCEMCGSTDIIKQDGVYVCQYCGCKYTPEEAKKLLGTVRIDNTERLANLYQLARRAKNENNTALAAKYYNQIVVENPNDWEAVFYSTYYTAMECKIAEITTAATTITNNFPTVFKLIAENVQEEKQSDIFAEISTRISALSQILENAAVEHYNSHMSVSGVFSESSARITAIIYMVETFADYMVECFKSSPEVAVSIYKSALEIKKKSGGVNNLSKDWEDSVEEKILKISPKYRDVIELRGCRDKLSTLEDHLQELEKTKKKKITKFGAFMFLLILLMGIFSIITCIAWDGGLLYFAFGVFIIWLGGSILFSIPKNNKQAEEDEEYISITKKEIEELKKEIAKLEEEIMINK